MDKIDHPTLNLFFVYDKKSMRTSFIKTVELSSLIKTKKR